MTHQYFKTTQQFKDDESLVLNDKIFPIDLPHNHLDLETVPQLRPPALAHDQVGADHLLLLAVHSLEQEELPGKVVQIIWRVKTDPPPCIFVVLKAESCSGGPRR